ncbi:MAG: hypothetical protein VYE73_02380 [Acidobacteriota bacterium]|nr:hypothetical protein [Acidobacteriota bacterium]
MSETVRSGRELLVLARSNAGLGRAELQRRLDIACDEFRAAFPGENQKLAVFAMTFQERLGGTTKLSPSRALRAD